ncbi:hypothetical protein AB0H83_39135 [Dactylosporangium sp. NPDC050688]|uniref:hypothetical protein n=1 Tax=Dactylosporangium sp. NPDC050688 TaxID=3157217 RepID=UPI0033E3578D
MHRTSSAAGRAANHPPPPRPSRVCRADDILTGRVNLDGYPFRYIVLGPAVSVSKMVGAAFNRAAGENTMFDEVLSAVELLETRGWELVSMDQGFVACLRRVAVR